MVSTTASISFAVASCLMTTSMVPYLTHGKSVVDRGIYRATGHKSTAHLDAFDPADRLKPPQPMQKSPTILPWGFGMLCSCLNKGAGYPSSVARSLVRDVDQTSDEIRFGRNAKHLAGNHRDVFL